MCCLSSYWIPELITQAGSLHNGNGIHSHTHLGRWAGRWTQSIGLIIRDWFRIGFIWGSRPKLPILSISKGLVKHWHFRPILSQSALSGIGWLALDWKKGEYFTLGLVQTLRVEMSCFHLFWLENAGWTGAFGAGAAFWEPGKFVAEEERNVENQIQIQIQCSVNKYKYWEPGKLEERLVCSFLISSSMETART